VALLFNQSLMITILRNFPEKLRVFACTFPHLYLRYPGLSVQDRLAQAGTGVPLW
jgi:hypothetical protein